MYVIFWGYGDWALEDGHTFIPLGSQLYLLVGDPLIQVTTR